jgi:putative Mg2+ transporter-C (MgtC) family protein
MLDWLDVTQRLAAATAIGAGIGVNRDLHNKPSGLRTLSLVSIGAALMVMLVGEIGGDSNGITRVLQGIMTGLGFLGAGVIVHEASARRVHGLTTAAAIWLTACLGSACGLGAWRLVLVAGVLVAVVLVVGGPIERWIHARIGQDDDSGQTD